MFVDGFLCCAKAFEFNKDPFVYFCFISFALGDRSKKILLTIYVKECSAYVLFWEFYGFHLTFRSSIHFEFIFIYGVRECFNFIISLYIAVKDIF